MTFDETPPVGAKMATVDPVCGMTVDSSTAKHRAQYAEQPYYFCSAGCKTKFEADPVKYLKPQHQTVTPVAEGAIYTCPMHAQIRQVGPGSCPIREMRMGSHYTIALARADEPSAPPTLADIENALTAPVFVPFAGRKANALMLPMAPRIVSAEDITGAFTAYDVGEPPSQKAFRKAHWLTPKHADSRIYADVDLVPRQLTERIEQRRDIPESRAKGRFGLRAEALLKPTLRGDRP